MAKQFSQLNDSHKNFIKEQKVFFVATAAAGGRVNVSPKGMDSFRVLSDNRVAWLNVTGSGNETAAHIKQLNRMTIMFNAFEGPPLILRLYGTATIVNAEHPDWHSLYSLFPELPGARQIFDCQIEMVQTSCGMAVPYYDFVSSREDLINWADKQGEEGIARYWKAKNTESIDGFPTDIS